MGAVHPVLDAGVHAFVAGQSQHLNLQEFRAGPGWGRGRQLWARLAGVLTAGPEQHVWLPVWQGPWNLGGL